jgi:hypothetical protein
MMIYHILFKDHIDECGLEHVEDRGQTSDSGWYSPDLDHNLQPALSV